MRRCRPKSAQCPAVLRAVYRYLVPVLLALPMQVTVTLLLAAPFKNAVAQQPAVTRGAGGDSIVKGVPVSGRAGSTANWSADDRYRIGPGDLLSITILDYPQLSSDSIKVDSHGTILMPLITGDISAACRTEGELAKEIGLRYAKYLKEPQVKVFVKEYQSQPVAIIGAVNAPGRFQLQRRVRLLELLTFAGGPAERAGRSIQIIHSGSTQACETASGSEGAASSSEGFVSLSLNDTLRGAEQANPFVQPGDIITIPVAEQAYIVGNVRSPVTLALKEPVTVSEAIARAGGTLPDTKSDRVRIVRQVPGSMTKKEIFVDLKAIDRRQAEDIAIQPNDIIDVPKANGVAKGLRELLRSLAPLAIQVPTRVIY